VRHVSVPVLLSSWFWTWTLYSLQSAYMMDIWFKACSGLHISPSISDCQGFWNPCGLRVGYAGVGVWVGHLQPLVYPYPRHRFQVTRSVTHHITHIQCDEESFISHRTTTLPHFTATPTTHQNHTDMMENDRKHIERDRHTTGYARSFFLFIQLY